ncbi:MAG: hypothetical protein K2L13_02205 [Opitutales bacterium]|nr:hypothetical protein [Opitutales bacterium]
MDSFESVCGKLIKQPEFWTRILIGIVVSAIPFVNIFALGYLRRMVDEPDRGDNITLPVWDFSVQNIRYNFIAGLQVLIFLLIFLFVPMGIGYAIGICFSWLSSSMSLFLTYLAFLIGLPTAVYAMLIIRNMDELASVQIVLAMFKRTIDTYRSLIVPVFLFLCLVILGVQFLPRIMLGMPLFLGLIFMIAFMKNLRIVYDR